MELIFIPCGSETERYPREAAFSNDMLSFFVISDFYLR